MPRFFQSLTLFAFGALFAVLVAVGAEFSSRNEPASDSSDSRPEAEQAGARASFTFPGRNFPENVPLREPEQKVELSDKLQALFVALDDGSLSALQGIRSEYVSFLPKYQSEVLPALKERALQNLVKRFAVSDWTDWPNPIDSESQSSSQARMFVDDITLVNSELGRFLETAAQLFKGMFLSVMSGQPYLVEEDLYYTIHNAEEIFSGRAMAALPARMLIDPSVISDLQFNTQLERLRAELVHLYFDRFPDDLAAQLRLVDSLSVSHCGENTVAAIKNLIQRLSLEASAKYRLSVKNAVLDSKVIAELAIKDQGVAKALAEFHSILAVDFLQESDKESAERLLKRSMEIHGGLVVQEVIAEYLRSETPKSPPGDKSAVIPQASEAKKRSPKQESDKESFTQQIVRTSKSASSGFMSGIVWFVVIAAILFVAGRFILAFLSKRNVAAEPDIDTRPSEREAQLQSEIMENQEMDFDAFDDILDQDIANS